MFVITNKKLQNVRNVEQNFPYFEQNISYF